MRLISSGRNGKEDERKQEERKARFEEKTKKERSWDLYREENRERWLERRRKENLRRLEDEKREAATTSHHKQTQADRKYKEDLSKLKKKETKPEYSRRMEEKTRLEGKQRMNSNLRKQRREQDGRLVSIWKELKAEEETNNKGDGNQKSCQEEEERSTEDIEDPWLEDINLTEAERSKLMELEQWYLTSYRSTNLANPSESPANIGIQPPGRSSLQDQTYKKHPTRPETEPAPKQVTPTQKKQVTQESKTKNKQDQWCHLEAIQPPGTSKQALHQDKQLLPIEVNKTTSFTKTSSLRPTLVNQPTRPTTVTPRQLHPPSEIIDSQKQAISRDGKQECINSKKTTTFSYTSSQETDLVSREGDGPSVSSH